jgi:hypothetical protein
LPSLTEWAKDQVVIVPSMGFPPPGVGNSGSVIVMRCVFLDFFNVETMKKVKTYKHLHAFTKVR